MLSDRDYTEFRGYLRNCTDAQVRGVYEKEREAGRTEYRRLAEQEANARGIEVREA